MMKLVTVLTLDTATEIRTAKPGVAGNVCCVVYWSMAGIVTIELQTLIASSRTRLTRTGFDDSMDIWTVSSIALLTSSPAYATS